MNQFEEQARRMILEYIACRSASERITYIEALGDRGLDLAILEEVMRLAVIGSVAVGLELTEK